MKIHVVDLVGRQIELVQHSEEEILLRVGVEVVRVVVEAEVVGVVTLQLLPAQQQVLFADLVGDLGGVNYARVSLLAREPGRLDQRQGNFHFLLFHRVQPRLLLDLLGQGRQMGLRHKAVTAVQPPQLAVDLPQVQPVDRCQLRGHGVQVAAVGFVGDSRLADLPHHRGLARLFAWRIDLLYEHSLRVDLRPDQFPIAAAGRHPRHDVLDQSFDHQRRQVELAQHQGFAAGLLVRAPQVLDGLAVGLLQLPVQHAAVVHREIDAPFMRIARHLAQAAGAGLQHEIVAAAQLAGQHAGEEAGAVPALGALVDQQHHPVAASAGRSAG